jgi:hypothetical protein
MVGHFQHLALIGCLEIKVMEIASEIVEVSLVK